jgi:hypothetical protein
VVRALRTRVLALLALLVITGSVPVSISALLHEGADDACAVTFIAHDESAHRVGGARTSSPEPRHCVVCHWLQSVQTVATATGVVPASTGCHHLPISDLPPARAAAIGQLSARAPPSAI